LNHLPFYQHITKCNRHNLNGFIKWVFQGQQIGWITHRFAPHLKQWPTVFSVEKNQVKLLLENHSQDEITQQLDHIIKQLVTDKKIKNYHNEPYPVVINDRNQPIFIIDRSSSSTFGVRAFGQHLNGYVIKNQQTYLWVAKRASEKITFPGKLDHIVAGGLPFGLSLQANLIKECAEEAGIDAALAQQAKAVSAITYQFESKEGLRRDTIYAYDIELPLSFSPKPVDGEVESFKLMPVDEVMDIVANTNQFKVNCNLVLIDFFIRHGFITAEHPEYLALIKDLHSF
jgi:isopentenyldiphosphate isomerase